MRVVIIANPRSGSGRGAQLADATAAFLRGSGVRVDRVNVGPGLPSVNLKEAISGADAAVAAGGDGTVRSLASVCMAAAVPLYHLPSGNENLFAREFGMDRNPGTLLAALRRGRICRCDVGAYPQQPGRGEREGLFLLMASVGPDAGVCHRLQATRTRGIGHRAYVGPVFEEFQSPAISRVQVWCDGHPVAHGRGMVVVANCRQYGMRIDPCHQASTTDGLFDVAFIPADTAVDAFVSLARLRFRMPAPDIVRAVGSAVRIELSGQARLQVDGEAETLAEPPPPQQVVEFTILRSALPVLDAR